MGTVGAVEGGNCVGQCGKGQGYCMVWLLSVAEVSL